jgi:hypothetical protein
VWLKLYIVAVICKACSVISASCGIVMHLHGWSRFGWPVQLVFAKYFQVTFVLFISADMDWIIGH